MIPKLRLSLAVVLLRRVVVQSIKQRECLLREGALSVRRWPPLDSGPRQPQDLFELPPVELYERLSPPPLFDRTQFDVIPLHRKAMGVPPTRSEVIRSCDGADADDFSRATVRDNSVSHANPGEPPDL